MKYKKKQKKNRQKASPGQITCEVSREKEDNHVAEAEWRHRCTHLTNFFFFFEKESEKYHKSSSAKV